MEEWRQGDKNFPSISLKPSWATCDHDFLETAAWRFLDEHEIYEHHTVYPMVETFLVAAVTLGHKTLRTLRHKTMGPKRRDVTPVRKKNYNSKREDNKGEDHGRLQRISDRK